eukprot:scaffold127264_cov17-Tisochrysis_lutea.AAC.1
MVSSVLGGPAGAAAAGLACCGRSCKQPRILQSLKMMFEIIQGRPRTFKQPRATSVPHGMYRSACMGVKTHKAAEHHCACICPASFPLPELQLNR